MLTYSSSSNTVCIFSLKKIVSALIAKSLWGDSFESDYSKSQMKDVQYMWEVMLRRSREETIRTLDYFIEENQLPPGFKTIIIESIYLLSQAYHQMLLWKLTYDPEDMINLLQVGELYAPNCFTVDGEFKDFMWAKRYVSNSNYDINCRFNLACCYWFENETEIIWSELKILSPFAGETVYLQEMVTLRVFQLKNKLEDLSQIESYEGNFWEVGLNKSAKNGYEYATYYFWKNLSESQRISLIENGKIFDLLIPICDNVRIEYYPRNKINPFLYSQLSNKEKQKLLDWTITYKKPRVWLSLLRSPYCQTIRSEITEFVQKLPGRIYSEVFELLAHRINRLKLPFDMKLFNALWSNLAPKEKHVILEKENIAIFLAQTKSFYNLGYIIKGLTLKQKQRGLINGCYAIWNCLAILCHEDEYLHYEDEYSCYEEEYSKDKYDIVQEFLSFFLIDLDPHTQKEMLRKDASLFLQKFIKPWYFEPWSEIAISLGDQIKIRNIINTFQINLTLLDEICDSVCKEVITLSDFKSNLFKDDPNGKTASEKPISSSFSYKRKYEE